MSDLKPGDYIGGEYRVLRVFGGEGKSGMGVVYLVEGRTTERPFVLKTFQSSRVDAESLARFKAEAATWVNVGKHPNIVQCHWVNEFSGQLFVAAEYIGPDTTGRNTLAHHLTSGGLSLQQQLQWTAHFCFGMKHAMAHGLGAHRDIKPDNLMIDTRGRLKITDFGLAKGISRTEQRAALQVHDAEHENMTATGSAFGTAPFMSPEQFLDSSAVDHRADIYSFGIVIYLMLSGGRLPFVPVGDGGWALAHFRQPVPRIDHPLMRCVEKCLEKDRRRRFQNYDEILSAIRDVGQKAGIGIPTDEQDTRAEFLRQWSIAMSQINLDHPESAISTLRAMQSRWREEPEIYTELFRAYWKLGDMEQALAATEKALQIDRYSTADWNNLGGILTACGRLSEARDAYMNALRIEPENTGAMISLAQLLMTKGELNEAKSLCERALFWRPEKAIVLQVASDCFAMCGEAVRAVELLNKLIAVNPDDAIAWFKKGNAMSGLGRSEDALDCYDKAIASARRTNEVWRFRGGSTKAVVRAVPAERIEAEAWNSRGLILKAAGRYVDALHSYDAALEIDPRRADIWCNHGNALSSLGRLAEALASFDKAVGLDPKDKKSWCNRGVVLKALGRLGEAIKCYDTALQIDPKDVKTWFNRGNAFAALDLYEEALESFREAQNLGDSAAAKYVEQCRQLLKRDV